MNEQENIEQSCKPEENCEIKYINLVLSGGSVKGISHLGAIKKLIDEKLIDLTKLKAIAGSSIGSLLALLIVLGFTIDEIWEFIYNLNIEKMMKPNFCLLLEKCGIETGQSICNLLEEIIYRKTNIKHITFKQLYEITNIHYTIVGSCLTTKEVVYFDHIKTPLLKVSMAIRISISIPGLFTPVTINNKKYIDGAILNNYPMNIFEKEMDKTIGVLIGNEYNTDFKYPEEYVLAIMNLFMCNYYEKSAQKYSNNTVLVNKIPKKVSVFGFNIDNETKIDLYNCGIEAVNDFVNKKN